MAGKTITREGPAGVEELVFPIWPILRNGYLMALRHKTNCRQTFEED